MDYFTSDLHFGHKNIIDYCKRPYASVEEMNRDLIAKFNARVTANDTVYIIGDVAMGPKSLHHTYVQQLSGHKILIIGNHDQKPDKMLSFGFAEVHSEFILNDPKHGMIYLRHHPKADHAADYHLCGHVHAEFDRIDKIINVGVDVRGFEPKTLDELIDAPFVGKMVDSGYRSTQQGL